MLPKTGAATMSYVVEVRHIGSDDFADLLVEMRNWFDRNAIQPETFDHSAGGPGITFRLRFGTGTDAAAFAQAFGGRQGMGDPHGRMLWVMSAIEQ